MATAARGWPSRGWAWRASPTGPMPPPGACGRLFRRPGAGRRPLRRCTSTTGAAPGSPAADGQLNHIAARGAHRTHALRDGGSGLRLYGDAASVYCATPGRGGPRREAERQSRPLAGRRGSADSHVADSVRGAGLRPGAVRANSTASRATASRSSIPKGCARAASAASRPTPEASYG